MITSPQNPKLKAVRALLSQSKTRREAQQLVLEGVRLIHDVIGLGFEPEFLLHRPEVDLSWLKTSAPIFPVEPSLFDDLSDTEHSQGILAVFAQPDLKPKRGSRLFVAVDGLKDAGNLGTIIRTSAAAGADGVILLPKTVDPTNPKCVRAGMGGHFRLPVFYLNWADFGAQFGEGWQIFSADVNPSARPYTDPLWGAPTILIIGSEAHGISEAAHAYIHQSVYIPMQNGVESLNSSVAAAILLFEISRQNQL